VVSLLTVDEWRKRRAAAQERLSLLLQRNGAAVEAYMAVYGLTLKPDRVARIAQQMGQAEKDPVYEIQAVCPVCQDSRPYKSHMVRLESQRLETNDYMVPVAAEGVKGYWPCNPITYQVHVCPWCGYATADRDELLAPDTRKAKKPMRCSAVVMQQLCAGATARVAITGDHDIQALFGRPRDLEVALLAFRMAIESERPRAEAELGRAHFRMANYTLRIAAISEVAHVGEGAPGNVDSLCRQALGYLETEYSLDGSDDLAAPISYLVLALAIRLKDDVRASQYHQILEQTARRSEGTVEGRQFEKWRNRAKELWENWREQRRG